MRSFRARSVCAHRRVGLGLVAAVLATASVAGATDPAAAKGSPPPGPSADGGAGVQLDERGITDDRRASLLGESTSESADRAFVAVGGADGVSVMSAAAADGYAWHQVATLPVPAVSTDLWIANSCVTASGSFMAVVYAPRAATNSEAGFGGGANAAIVDLRSGQVTDLGTGYTVAYFNPACGGGDNVTITRFDSDLGKTRVAVVDAALGAVARTVELAGQATSAVARKDGTVIAAMGADIVSVAPGSTSPKPLLAKVGAAYDLTVDSRDRLAYVVASPDRTRSGAYITQPSTSGKPSLVGTGPIDQVGLHALASGGLAITGRDLALAGRAQDGVTVLRGAGPSVITSSTGAMVIDQALPAEVAARRPADASDAAQVVTDVRRARIDATVVRTGAKLAFSLDEGAVAESPQPGLAASEVRPAKGLVPTDSGGAMSITGTSAAAPEMPQAQARTAAAAMVGDPHDTVEAERFCSVARNDPNNQAYQPKPRQVEWAVDRAVKGQLTEARPANWRNLGMASYTPQVMFPKGSLTGWPNSTIPPQVVLGVLMQESNLWQADRYTAPGNAGNPLIGDFYGSRKTGSIWTISFPDADCGYGIGQITDGMRVSGHPRTDPATGLPIETALPLEQQRAIALDYEANIAKVVQMLTAKWNELSAAGMLLNGGDPQYIENWFLATWSYNSGFHAKVDSTSPWGVGWFNNPINPNYSPSRLPFLEGGQGDAAHPERWPYPEKIIGWAAYGSTLTETQWVDQSTRTYPTQTASSYRTAGWPSTIDRSNAKPPVYLFCDPAVNDCNPSLAQPCTLSTSSTHNFECWWHKAADWRTGCTNLCARGFERFNSTYATEASSMATTLPPRTLQSSFKANCTRSNLPTGAVIVDDTTHLDARNSGECSHVATAGTFQFTFPNADSLGSYPAKVDLHQQGGGFNGHFSFAHMQVAAAAERKITGTWSRGANMDGTWTRVWVHLPDYAGWTQQAGYTINVGDGTSETRYLPQRRYANEWVSLGVLQMKGVPSVSLSNVLVDSSKTGSRVATGRSLAHGLVPTVDIAGYDDVAWDAVAFEPLSAKPTDFVVALGDSYGSGEGAGDYYAWSDNNGSNPLARNACHQSKGAWIRKTVLPGRTASIGAMADALDPTLDLQFLDCSGAQTENLLPYYTATAPEPVNVDQQNGEYGQYGTVSQLDAGYLDGNTTLVAISIGGNDVRFADILTKCAMQLLGYCGNLQLSDDEKDLPNATADRISYNLIGSLAIVVGEVRKRAPNAEIAIFGYPKIFESATLPLAIGEVNKAWLNDISDMLNEAIDAVVQYLDTPGTPPVFFVNPQETFAGRNLGAESSAINGIVLNMSPGDDPLLWDLAGQLVSAQSGHPNDDGTSLYAQAFQSALAALP